jgi:hypothetical protein
MPKLTADEIKYLIEKYIGQTGIIHFYLKKKRNPAIKVN